MRHKVNMVTVRGWFKKKKKKAALFLVSPWNALSSFFFPQLDQIFLYFATFLLFSLHWLCLMTCVLQAEVGEAHPLQGEEGPAGEAEGGEAGRAVP